MEEFHSIGVVGPMGAMGRVVARGLHVDGGGRAAGRREGRDWRVESREEEKGVGWSHKGTAILRGPRNGGQGFLLGFDGMGVVLIFWIGPALTLGVLDWPLRLRLGFWMGLGRAGGCGVCRGGRPGGREEGFLLGTVLRHIELKAGEGLVRLANWVVYCCVIVMSGVVVGDGACHFMKSLLAWQRSNCEPKW